MPGALLAEAQLRKDYLSGAPIDSVYFGGGTPSILPVKEIERIITGLREQFEIKPEAEITLEANPDDLQPAYLEALAESSVNRLSVGIQSFKQSDLDFMNRAHNAAEALACLEALPNYGFENYSIDLIYGLPEQSAEDWLEQLQYLQRFKVPHFSAYALTIEEKTKLAYLQKKGEVKVEDERAAEHFELLQQEAERMGYQHYELSNFALPRKRAIHNSNYWQAKPYLGLGPSAHSFNGGSRAWNRANNKLYLQAIEKEHLALEEEHLSEKDRYNEWLMTGLRLIEGIAQQELEKFSPELRSYALREINRLLQQGKLEENQRAWRIPRSWRFYSDGIAADLFYTD